MEETIFIELKLNRLIAIDFDAFRETIEENTRHNEPYPWTQIKRLTNMNDINQKAANSFRQPLME